MKSAMNSEDFAAAIDSARRTLSGWGTGGRDYETPITEAEIQQVAKDTAKLYNGNEQDVADLISQLS